jgi:fructoselysine 6-phosphate deglycase
MTQAAAAVKPVADDLEQTLHGALRQRDAVSAVAASAISGGLGSVWFVACGGSFYASSPAGYLLDRKGRSITGFRMTASEFNYRRPARVGSGSLVVVASHSGTTPETLQAVDTARALGATTVIGLTRSPDSPLAAAVDTVFTYGSKDTVWEPKQILLAHLVHSLLTAAGDEARGEAEAAGLGYEALPGVLREAVTSQDGRLAEIAVTLAYEPVIYVLGSGPSEDVARCLAMCYLQEMQWLHAAAFNAGEFFHGAFEVVTGQTAVIVLTGEDQTRPATERAVRFVQEHTRNAHIIDTRSLALPGVPAGARAEISPIVLGSLAFRLAQHFEAVTGHPLTDRRYMFKVSY